MQVQAKLFPPSTSIQRPLYTICRVQQRLQPLNMRHRRNPPLNGIAKPAPFQPLAPCPSFFKYPQKSHSAFKPETQRPAFCGLGEAPPRGCLLYVAALVRLFACLLACRVLSRARSFVCAIACDVQLCMIVSVASMSRVSVSVSVVASRPWPWLRGRA